MKSHNENNHIQASEKRSPISVIIIHIQIRPFEESEKILHPAIFVVTGVYGKEN